MINSIGYPNTVNEPQKVAFKSNPVENEKKKVSTTTKTLIGASALAAAVVGGLLVHKGIQTSKLNKVVNELKSGLLDRIRLNGITNPKGKSMNQLFDNNILQKHINDAAKLPKKEQISRLKELSIVNDGRQVPFDTSHLPKEVQDAIASKDQFKAMKAYTEYCDTLFHKSKTAGATVQESIENIFGKGSKIKPHTYNPADEAQYIGGYIDMGGYKDLAINSQNQIAHGLNHSALSVIDPSVISNAGKIFTESGAIQKAVYNGRTYVRINIPNGKTGNCLLFVSKDGKNLTPVQKDLLSLKDKLSKKELALFEKMLSNRRPDESMIVEQKDIMKGGKDSPLGFVNYDVTLSTIQTLAEKYKPAKTTSSKVSDTDIGDALVDIIEGLTD